jgi:hypothetical protein
MTQMNIWSYLLLIINSYALLYLAKAAYIVLICLAVDDVRSGPYLYPSECSTFTANKPWKPPAIQKDAPSDESRLL